MRSLAALLLLACSCAAAAPRASIELQAQAGVAGARVLLGQVAHIRSEDLELARRLVRLPVAAAPRGGTTSLARDQIAAAMAADGSFAGAQLDWSGAGAVRITPVSQRASGDEIADAAVQGVRAALHDHGEDRTVRVRARPRDVETGAGEVRLVVRDGELAPLRRLTVAWVEVWLRDAFVRAVPVPLEILGVPMDAAREGEPATTAVAPSVSRGDWATLATASGAVRLESRVEVLQDGRVGQRVRVRQPGGSGMVFARVLGAGRLELAP